MIEILLAMAAFLLALLCLIYGVRQNRALYAATPDGSGGAPKNPSLLYPAMPAILLLSAGALIGERLGGGLELGADLVRPLGTAQRGFQIALFAVLALYTAWLLRRRRGWRSRAAVLTPAAVALTGLAIRLIWNVRVELFFEAVALFGCLGLFERDADASERGAGARFRSSMTLTILLTLLAVIALNVTQILRLSHAQSEEIGNTQLEVISNELQDTITGAETDLLRVAISAENLMDSGASREALTSFFYEQYNKRLSNDGFLSVYVAGPDWHVIPEFSGPADFHAAERVWYLGALEHPGEVYITEPYMDANGHGMCFSVSTLLHDGETVVGMDLDFSKAQESILRMTHGRDQTAMIVTSGGLIAGYTDMSLVGERADEKLPAYADILKRVAASREHRSFRVELDGKPCVIFSAETDNGWYLILSVDNDALYGESYRQTAVMLSVNLLMLAVVAIYCLRSARKTRQTERALAESRSRIDGSAARLRELAAHLLRLGDARLFREGEDPAELIGQVRESGQRLSDLTHGLTAYSEALRREEEQARADRAEESAEAPSRRVRNGIVVSMLLSLAAVLTFCISISMGWGTSRLEREADGCENQLNAWLAQQKIILYMFTDVISSRPDLLDDYEGAVGWLRRISDNYPDISLCYMANPYAAHPVIMSNGWEPGADYRPETRPWYRATVLAPDGFNISKPYLDAQSGNYCVTLSRVVYGEQEEFLGIFGVDFFLDKLIQVLGESYTSRSYAFLVDSEGAIVNHPNADYQMGARLSRSIEDTEYADAYNRERVTPLRDYASHFMACLSRRSASGFTVVVAGRWWNIYGSAVLVTVVFLLLFGMCLTYIVSMLNRLTRWQERVNRQLVASAEEAQNANLAKSRFLSQMSHEIRTPMNAIIGLDSLALRDASISDHTRDALEKIGASARHLLSLINDILDMSRIESGRMVLRHEVFPFRDFLAQINVIASGQCDDKGLRFVCNQTGPLDESFVGDDLKLRQVLINILGNAVKFTEAPGVITFTVAQTDADAERANLVFTVKDTGIGMDRDFLPRLFEAFTQEDNGNTTRYGGSGLGMAITKSFVDMMGGVIEVESEKGLGSTFRVSVPLGRVAAAAAQPAEPAAGEAPAVSLAGRHLLIAEDQAMNAEVLADLLELEEMSSEWAENGQLAVERFAQSEAGHFDAILMDMRMPVMDGLAATRTIRQLERPDAATIPIVALTANAFEEDVKQCLQAGMNAHLSKPVDIDLLKQTLSRLLPAKHGA